MLSGDQERGCKVCGGEEWWEGAEKGERRGEVPRPSLHLEPDIALLPERGRSPLFPSLLHPYLFSF